MIVSFLLLIAVLFVIVVGVEIVARLFKLPLELSRKSTHILTGVAVALSAPFVEWPYRALLAVMFIAVILISRRRGIFRSIHDANRVGLGELWYPIGILAASLLFHQVPAFMYAVLVLAVSDGLAGLLGKYFGRKKFTVFNANKTYVGSLVFAASAAAIGLMIGLPLIIALGGAIVLTIIELVARRGIDNVLLPIAAGLIALVELR